MERQAIIDLRDNARRGIEVLRSASGDSTRIGSHVRSAIAELVATERECDAQLERMTFEKRHPAKAGAMFHHPLPKDVDMPKRYPATRIKRSDAPDRLQEHHNPERTRR